MVLIIKIEIPRSLKGWNNTCIKFYTRLSGEPGIRVLATRELAADLIILGSHTVASVQKFWHVTTDFEIRTGVPFYKGHTFPSPISVHLLSHSCCVLAHAVLQAQFLHQNREVISNCCYSTIGPLVHPSVSL